MGVRLPPGAPLLPRELGAQDANMLAHTGDIVTCMKRCGRCREWKSCEAFARRTARGDGLQPFCKLCQHVTYTTHYAKNRAAYRAMLTERTNRQRAINRRLIADHLARHPCVDCGLTDRIVLEFDHVRGTKVASIASMTFAPVALATLKAEIAKCEVRCANCHRRRTATSWRHTLRTQGKQENNTETAYYFDRLHGDCSSVG